MDGMLSGQITILIIEHGSIMRTDQKVLSPATAINTIS